MTTTTRRAPIEVAEPGGAPSSAAIADLITNAPVPRPTLVKTFNAMMAREFRVLRRNAVATFTRAVMQPLLFVFVFAYVFPKIGGGFNLGGGAAAAGASVKGSINFATILVPGLMASMLLMQGIMAVTFPLVMEFSWQRTIEDRALAPVPIRVLAIQKIVAGAVQSFIGAVIVFPIVLFVHAAGQAPHVHVTNWALFIVILAFASLLTASLGLLLGTIMDPRKMQMLFAVILLPATMLGCVYYPWAALHHIRWLQIAVLINPMVYMSEGLRAVLTPVLPHMPMWAVLVALRRRYRGLQLPRYPHLHQPRPQLVVQPRSWVVTAAITPVTTHDDTSGADGNTASRPGAVRVSCYSSASRRRAREAEDHLPPGRPGYYRGRRVWPEVPAAIRAERAYAAGTGWHGAFP